MRPTQSRTSWAASPTGTIFPEALLTWGSPPVRELHRRGAGPAVAGATASPRLAVEPRAHSHTSTQRTSRASLWSIARLVRRGAEVR